MTLITKIIIIFIAVIAGLAISAFLYEIKNAPQFDEDEPFLWTDYKEKKKDKNMMVGGQDG